MENTLERDQTPPLVYKKQTISLSRKLCIGLGHIILSELQALKFRANKERLHEPSVSFYGRTVQEQPFSY